MATTKTSTQKKSPWLAVTIGLLGLVIGYTAVVGAKGEIASASSYSCPMKHLACTSGVCSKDCPGNCKHSS